jgi:hypothetical protein
VDDPECDLHPYSYANLYDQQLYSDGINWGRSIRGLGDALEQDSESWSFSDLYSDNECGLYGLGL